jgi:Na+(H+)/acetate symporter ActP
MSNYQKYGDTDRLRALRKLSGQRWRISLWLTAFLVLIAVTLGITYWAAKKTTSSLAVISFYLIAQMVGAGSLVKLLFGIDYALAVLIVGGIMMAYVIFGGMIATTWVPIIKAVLLLGGATLMAVLALSKFGFNPLNLFAAVVAKYPEQPVLAPGKLVANPWDSGNMAAPMLAELLGGNAFLGFISAVVVGIVVSLLTPETDAAERFIETEHRIAGDF